MSSANKVFALEKPSPRYQECRLKHIREYLVGPAKKMFRYAHEVDSGVCYDEVVRVDKPCRVHFDIEMKRLGVESLEGYNLFTCYYSTSSSTSTTLGLDVADAATALI
jgi:hypothetical protein